MKKIGLLLISLVLAVVCFVLLPTEARAASESDLTFTLNSDGQSYCVASCDYSASGALIIPSTYNGLPVTKIGGWAFFGCCKLESITIPDSITSIGASAFHDLLLTGIWVDEDNEFYTSDAYGVLFNKDRTELIRASSSLAGHYEIPSSVTSIGECAFWNCTSLISVTIPDGVTRIGDYMFLYCTSLTSVTIPDSVTSIGDSICANCDKLNYNIYDNGKYLGNNNNPYLVFIETISDSITSCQIHSGTKVISDSAFSNCTSLISVTIPDSVTTIGKSAFSHCDNLSSIIYCGTQEQWDSIAIEDDNTELTNAELQFHNHQNGVCTGCGHKAVYTITFEDWDGTVISSNTYHWGDVIEVPADPTKEADNTYTYTFAGWDKAVVDCAGNATYTATFTPIYIDYTVVFKNWNGDVLSTETYHWGDVIAVPADPTKAADNTYTYAFAGWDKDVVNCEGNAVYTATYQPSFINYTVVFQDGDGTILSSQTYHWGDEITVPADPSRTADYTYTYTFAGWDKEVVNCEGNATYTAIYNPKYIDYIVAFKNWDGSILSIQTYHYGDKVDAPADPTKAADNTYTYAFAGWDKDVVNCEGNAVYTAIFNAEHYHSYDNACDTTCNTCEAIRSITHTYTTIVTNATLSENGSIVEQCSVCGNVASSTVIMRPTSFALSATSYTYDGKVKTPAVTVKDAAGNVLVKGTDYTVSYPSGRKTLGTYTVTITMQGNYTGTKTLTFKINLATPTVKVANAAKGVTVSWNKISGAKTYTVYRSVYSGGKWSGWKAIKTGVTGTSFTDTTVKTGTTVKYTVRAVNGKYVSAAPGSVATKFLATPTVKVANAAKGVKVSWNKVSGAKTYTVYRSVYSGGKWSGWKAIKTGVTGTSFTDTTVKSGTTVKYTVRAVNGKYTSAAPGSVVTKFLAQPAVKVAKTSTGIKASWGKSAGVTGYIVYRRTYTNGAWSGWTKIKTTTGLSYTDTTAKKGVSYQYTARAYSGSYKSAYTNSASIKR